MMALEWPGRDDASRLHNMKIIKRNFPADLAELVDHCISFDPKVRPTAAALVEVFSAGLSCNILRSPSG
jgi:hypothetical protein